MNALNLPDDPGALLAEHAAAVDTAYREVTARLDSDGPATVDGDGRLHLAALKAEPDSPSLVGCLVRIPAIFVCLSTLPNSYRRSLH